MEIENVFRPKILQYHNPQKRVVLLLCLVVFKGFTAWPIIIHHRVPFGTKLILSNSLLILMKSYLLQVLLSSPCCQCIHWVYLKKFAQHYRQGFMKWFPWCIPEFKNCIVVKHWDFIKPGSLLKSVSNEQTASCYAWTKIFYAWPVVYARRIVYSLCREPTLSADVWNVFHNESFIPE